MTSTTVDVATATRPRTPLVPDPDAFRGPSLAKLIVVELRKALDTRSGRWLMLAVFGLGLAGIGWRLYNADNSPVTFELFVGTPMLGVQAILPVVGVMAMTAEWTQRTALSTFTTVPRRGPVLTAKVLSALVLGVVATVLVLAATALGTVLGGAVTSTDPSFDGAMKLGAGLVVANSLNLLMAAAFGAVIPQTAAAVTVFLVAPTLWASAGVAVLKDAAEWLNVFGAFGRLMYFDMSDLPQTMTSLAAWIVVPLVVGFVASMRREVK